MWCVACSKRNRSSPIPLLAFPNCCSRSHLQPQRSPTCDRHVDRCSSAPPAFFAVSTPARASRSTDQAIIGFYSPVYRHRFKPHKSHRLADGRARRVSIHSLPLRVEYAPTVLTPREAILCSRSVLSMTTRIEASRYPQTLHIAAGQSSRGRKCFCKIDCQQQSLLRSASQVTQQLVSTCRRSTIVIVSGS